ncbi:MAG TPA: cyclic peptide export ABC transporter [Bacillota bacterium]|nr:cyclic peptide export ABC transporter [Bacillota bacterium]
MKKKGLFFTGLLIVFLVTSGFQSVAWASSVSVSSALASSASADNSLPKTFLSKPQIADIEKHIRKQMRFGKIPGMAVVIVQGNRTVYCKGFGFADLQSQKPVTSRTLFELGSTSKAFTALGILKLEQEGYLALTDPVQKYLPWFQMKYRGQPVTITIQQLLHQTSGIPFKTIGAIPITAKADALETTVKTLVGQELDFQPGQQFLYATINYDVLGLIIQKVSGQTFENYMRHQVLNPLGLYQTYLSRHELPPENMATGYKLSFLQPRPYQAPVYRGNLPAGYFIINLNDAARWLKIQLGALSAPGFEDLIQRSHLPDRSVDPSLDLSSYAMGWDVYQRGAGEISHEGSNPNFASFIVFRPGEQLGVAVLANLDSSFVQITGQGIMDQLLGKKVKQGSGDLYRDVDSFATLVSGVTLLVGLISIVFLGIALYEFIQGQRRFQSESRKGLFGFLGSLLFLAGFGYCLYNIPNVLFQGLPWSFVTVWGPESFLLAIRFLIFAVGMFFIYFLFSNSLGKPDEKPYFSLCIFSVISGFGNAFIIFVINETLNRGSKFELGLFLYFWLGLILYIFGQKLVRTRLVRLTNQIVYQKRAELITKLLNTSYQRLEQYEEGSVQTVLNNDTETVSGFANMLISGVTSLITLVCCFIYLGILNIYGLLISIPVITIAAGLFYLVSQSADRLWEQTRDIQNIFFKFINDLIDGFKELILHQSKRDEFKKDMLDSCDTYRVKRTAGAIQFANVYVAGELLFTIVIGAVAFAFPVIFTGIQSHSIRSYIFIFLYMTGPVNTLLDIIPNLVQVKISWNRINQFLSKLSTEESGKPSKPAPSLPEKIRITLHRVEYHYQNDPETGFTVGPVDLELNSGEIIFITGGNGSGKSTLAKLLTGIYTPDAGEILINNTKVESQDLGEFYTAIFSDFYLFEKLYGVKCQEKQNAIESYLKLMRIHDKVTITQGKFSTIKLSSGQRKRLALLQSFLEDKPVYLFDEWAADQDPEFRQFFYESLLPQLKKNGKLVIAITHDDRYFHLANQVIKMELGKIIKTMIHPADEKIRRQGAQ